MTSQARLRVIRNVLLPGPIILGGVSLWMRASGLTPAVEASSLDAARIAVYGILTADFALLLVFRSFREKRQPSQRGAVSLMGWTTMETGALLAALFIFMGGEPWPLAVAVFMILISWNLLPADPLRV